MRLSKKNRLTIFICASVVLLFYQNCSQNFKSAQNNSTLASQSTPDPADNNPPSTTPPVTPPSPPTVPVTPTNKMVDVFMASGHMARTLFSCDDGKTWIHDQSQDDKIRCWVDGDPNYLECDHTPYAGRGIDSGDGWFFVNFGWGDNGSVRRSRDGVNWQTLRTDGWGGGVAYAKGFLFLLWKGGMLSADEGTTWKEYTNPPKEGFGHPWIKRLGDKFMMVGRPDNTNIVGMSLDQGATWFIPATIQVNGIKDIAEGNNRLVAIGFRKSDTAPTVTFSAVSMDAGKTWSVKEYAGSALEWGQIIFDGQKFVTWAAGKRWTSLDGLNWDNGTAMTVEKVNPNFFSSLIAYNPATGTYSSISKGFASNYDKQKAYRSLDGVNWTQLSDTAFRGGHPIRDIIHAKMDEAYCK